MALSRVSYPGAGSTATFVVPFPYINKAFVEVRLDGTLLSKDVGYTWPTSSTITLTSGNLQAGSVLDIRRNTPKNGRLVVFADASMLNEANLNVSANQVFHAVQEVMDDMDSMLRVAPDGTVSAGNRKISELVPGTAPSDAATVGQLTAVALENVQATGEDAAAAFASAQAAAASAQAAASSAATAGAQAGASSTHAGDALASAQAAAASAQAAAQSAAELVTTPGTVKVSPTDSTAGLLGSKITVAGSLTKTITGIGADEKVQLGLSVSYPVTSVGGYAGEVTASNLLEALKGVDGAGSGLDADTLDGFQATAFAAASHTHNYVLTDHGHNNVGSLCFARAQGSALTYNPGNVLAGSSLRPAGVYLSTSSSDAKLVDYPVALAGSWRCLGYGKYEESHSATLWQRIA